MSFEAHNLPKDDFSLQVKFSRQIFFAERITSLLSHLFQYFSLHLFCSYSVQNWSSEFRKWLGNERLKVYTVNSDKRVKVKNEHTLGGGGEGKGTDMPIYCF